MALNLPTKVVECLQKHPEQKLTAREIAEWVLKTYPEECRRKQERSTATVRPLDTDKELLTQIVADIGSQRPGIQKRSPKVKTTEGRPRKYYFTDSSDSSEIKHAEGGATSSTPTANSSVVREHDLYPILSEFLRSEFDVYSKRIDEKRSSNSRGIGGNKWLYPDLVGMEDLSREWHDEIKNCVREYSDKKAKLWSFEVKILINRSNVREAFFQTVSNSSWANFGYLVASEIGGVETLKELRMLTSLHGIGLMRLDAENPSESQIMIPAKERSEIDWDTANRLVEENRDFLEYIKLIRSFYQTGETYPSNWA